MPLLRPDIEGRDRSFQWEDCSLKAPDPVLPTCVEGIQLSLEDEGASIGSNDRSVVNRFLWGVVSYPIELVSFQAPEP